MGGICPCFAGVTAGPKPSTNASTAAGSEGDKPQPAKQAPEPVAAPQVPAAAAAQASESTPLKADVAPAPVAEAATVEAAPFGVGSFLDVFSNTANAWCAGVVEGCDDSSVYVVYQKPGTPGEPNLSTKTLPLDSPEIRPPADDGPWLNSYVEVFSHSTCAWCTGMIQQIAGGVAVVAFHYPDAKPDEEPATKNLPLGDQDLRLPGVAQATAAIGEAHLQQGMTVQVYSNSMGQWLPGAIHSIKDGIVTVLFYYPDMDPKTEEPAMKELPVGHQDIRLPPVSWTQIVNVDPADFVVGRPIEIYSHSRQVWIEGHIKDVEEGNVTATFRYPDMGEDSEFYEKVLPLGHTDLRLLPPAEA